MYITTLATFRMLAMQFTGTVAANSRGEFIDKFKQMEAAPKSEKERIQQRKHLPVHMSMRIIVKIRIANFMKILC